jgi:UDP-N-acetylglucosamine 2-epimerase (non-hydrolysing)
MKVAPLIHAIADHNTRSPNGGRKFEHCLVHTGQHYDAQMSQVFFEELQIPKPDVCLDVGSGSHAVQTARVMERFEPVCNERQPDWVIVVGDVNSTMACALVASKLGIKVAHVEAGLRSLDRTMPEEINRLVTDAISDLLFTPSEDASENLRREGVPEERILLVGNIMMDCLIANLEKARRSTILQSLGISVGGFAYVTLHRPSNVDDPLVLRRILEQLSRLGHQMPVIFPMHPRTRNCTLKFGIECGSGRGLRIIDPIGYHDSLALAENARLVLTDSGGLQEETTFFRTPCLTLRPNTERPVTITLGSNRLTAIDPLPEDIDDVLQAQPRLGRLPPLWDGNAARRVVSSIFQETRVTAG